MEKLSGVFCALWTPTDARGDVLWTALDRHLEFVLRSGVHGIMALGSTAEFPHFSVAQRKVILERIARACQRTGNLPIIANVSDVSCRNAVDLARHAKSVGATIAAVLPPWFFTVEQRDLAEFFVEVGRESGLPLGLYNFPEVTGHKIELKTIETVAQRVKLAVVKQSGAEFDYHPDLLKLGRELDFCVLTGSDTRLEEALTLGCTGTVSGLANAVPDVLSRIFNCFGNGSHSRADTQFVSEISRIMAPLQFPHNVKATIAARGFETGENKNPISKETRSLYETALQKLAQHYRDLPAI